MSRLLCLARRSRRRPVAYKETVVALVADRGSSGLSKPWCNRGQLPIKPSLRRREPLCTHGMRSFFLFSSLSSEPPGSALFAFFSRVIGVPVMGSAPFALLPRVVRAPVLGRAYSTAPTLFHAVFYKILRKLESEGPKYFARRGELFCFPNAE